MTEAHDTVEDGQTVNVAIMLNRNVHAQRNVARALELRLDDFRVVRWTQYNN